MRTQCSAFEHRSASKDFPTESLKAAGKKAGGEVNFAARR
jgi:hypothetical protein